MEEEKPKKQLTEKQKFWTLMSLFLTFSLLIPILYLTIRYDLFTKTTTIQIGLWGIILFGIMIAVISVLIKYYLSGLKTKYSYGKQVVEGVVKLILPLCLTLAVVFFLKDNMDAVIESLCVIIPSEFGAILVNPLPKWAFDNNVDGLAEISDKLFSRKHNTEKVEGESK